MEEEEGEKFAQNIATSCKKHRTMSFLTNTIQIFTYIENLEGFDTGVKMGPARDLAIVDCVGLEPEIMVIA